MSEHLALAQLQQLDTTPQKPINETHRFIMLIVATLGAICVSLLYAFNLISGKLQNRYDLSQGDLSTISAVAAFVQYFSLPYAFLYDHFGPSVTLTFAMSYFALGATCLALSFQGVIQGTVLRLSVFYAIMGSGCALFDLSSSVTIILHFPTNKGAIMALLKPFTGLGSAIVGCIYLAFFTSHVEWYFYFLTSFAVMTGILCLIYLRLPAYHLTGYQVNHLTDEQKAERMRGKAQYLRQRPPMRPFYFGFVIIILLIIFLPLQSGMMSYYKLSNRYAVAFAITTIALCLIYLLIAVPFPFFRRAEASSPSADSDDVTDVDVNGTAVVKCIQADATHNAQSDGRAVTDAVPETEVDYIAPQYEMRFFQSLCLPEIWLMWWAFFVLNGAELVVIFNASYILGAMSGVMPSEAQRTLLTVLNGVGSAIGRLIMSYYETRTQGCRPEDRIPITACLYFPNTSIIFAYILFIALPPNLLPIPYVIAALGNGFLASTTILLTRTLFAKDPAKYYCFCYTATMLTSVIFNRLIYGEWYSYKAKRIGDSKVCLQRECVMVPMIIVFCFTLTGFLSTTWLHIRYRRFSRMVLQERAHIREERVMESKDANSISDNN